MKDIKLTQRNNSLYKRSSFRSVSIARSDMTLVELAYANRGRIFFILMLASIMMYISMIGLIVFTAVKERNLSQKLSRDIENKKDYTEFIKSIDDANEAFVKNFDIKKGGPAVKYITVKEYNDNESVATKE